MSTAPDNLGRIGPEWNGWSVPLIGGTFDTRIKTGEDYEGITLAEIFTMAPDAKPKMEGPAFVPSTHHDFDAREHSAQREKGQFIALTGDVDTDDHQLAKIESLVRGFARDAAWLIYSSPHARPGNMRWRIIIPLARSLTFEHWHDAQNAFFDFMEESGVEMDRALARAAQLVFLPNVPSTHEKSGTELRGEDDEPLYYQRSTSGTNAPGLALNTGPIAAYVAAIRRQREADERERERIRKEAEERRKKQPRTEGAPILEEFNKSNSIATLFELYGYEQSPRHPEDWRSPHQTSESYATRIMGDKWVSLSASDVGARLGENFKGGCFGDAYDLFVHYEHSGDHKAAFRTLYSERRSASLSSNAPAPPPLDEEDPGWTEPPEDADAEPDIEAAAVVDDAPEILNVVHPADWQGTQPPVRVWRWKNFIPDMQATLITGAGASGKSLATQQMATCVAMGLPFLGVETRRCPSLYITCEDDLDELHRRQDAINAALGISPEATRGHLFLVSLQGEIANELAVFTQDGEMTIARRFAEIAQTCHELGVKHVTIDNTAHTFSGNENDRHQVAAFVNLNNRLAQKIGGSVLMVGHPNKAGDSYSGSTAWENQVRSRLYLEVPKNGDEGVPVDPDMRVIRNEKANYSQRGAEVTFYWLKGAFVTEEQMPQGNEREMRESAAAAYENGLFLTLLDKLTEQRRQVSHAPNVGTYAPKVMAAMPEARGLQKASLARAMERLFALGEIVASQSLWLGPDRHPVIGLARKDHVFQGRKKP